jgi:hypothetical protein
VARFDFCGGSYTSQVVNANCQRALNLYPEIDESQSGRSKMILLPTPGLVSIATLDGPPRAQLEYNGRLFVIAGSKLYEIVLTSLGPPIAVTANVLSGATALANDGLPASMAANETQLLMCSGGSVYLFTFAGSVFSTIAATNFTLPTGPAPVIQVAFCDSFFLALIANSQTVQISNVLDGSAWTLNGQIVVNVYPDNIIGMIVDHRELGLIGRKKSVAYIASTSANVFDVNPSSFVEQGGIATFAMSQVDNSVFWVGGDERGSGMGWRLNGYTPVRITTHAVELAWKSYPRRDNAVSYSYQDEGHSFWQVLFPSANNGNGATWDYDTASGLWHERDFLNVTTGASGGHPSWNHAFWNGAHIVGDWRSTNLYQMSTGILDNAGVPIRRVRRAPHISTELEVIRHSRFVLDMETGLGPEPPLQGGGTPTVLTLQDANGVKWGVTVLDNGTLQTTAGSLGAAQTIFLNVGAATWQLGVTITGLLTTTSVVFAVNPSFITMVSPSAVTAWDLAVTAVGLLTTTANLLVLARSPVVYLRWSDDGGHTWSNYQPRDAGQAGQYKVRLRWARLGRARIRTYEISCSDPIPVRFVDAYVNAQPGYQPSERLTHQYRKVA